MSDKLSRVLAVASLIVAVLALAFGGFFSARWTRAVNQSQVSVVVGRVTKSDKPVEIDSAALLTVPGELVEFSRKCKYIPNLEVREPRGELVALVESSGSLGSTMAPAGPPLRTARNRLTTNPTQRVAAEEWARLQDEEQSLLMAVRTMRRTIELRRAAFLKGNDAGSAEEIAKYIGEKLQNTGGSRNDESYDTFSRQAMAEALALMARLETEPTLADVQNALNEEDIKLIEDLATESMEFHKRGQAVLDANAAPPPRPAIRTEIYLFNSGGTPTTMYAAGVLVLPRSGGSGNVVHPLTSTTDQIVTLEPGKGARVTLEAGIPSGGDVKDYDNMTKWLDEGTLDCKVLLRTLDGLWIESERAPFSKRISEAVMRDFEDRGKQCAIAK